MKKLPLIIALCILPFLANAQVEQGRIFLSGSSSFNNSYVITDDGDTKAFSISLSPRIGKVISPNFVLGLETNIGYSKVSSGDSEGETGFLAGGPFIRYYFSSGTVIPYLGTGVVFGRQFSTIDSNYFAARLGGGVAFFVNESVSLDLGLGYTYDRRKIIVEGLDPAPDESGQIALSVGVSVFLD